MKIRKLELAEYFLPHIKLGQDKMSVFVSWLCTVWKYYFRGRLISWFMVQTDSAFESNFRDNKTEDSMATKSALFVW